MGSAPTAEVTASPVAMQTVPVVPPPKSWVWHLNRALTRQIYFLFVSASAVVLVWPGLTSTVHGTPAWRLLLDLTLYEVVLVDVLCKKHVPWKRPHEDRHGFPSGHATYSFALAVLVAWLHPALAAPWLVLALAISWSRIYLHAHYPYQVAGGALAGSLLAALVLWR